ncbi:hypothetical protein [Psychroserpens sp. MEBiC05023]
MITTNELSCSVFGHNLERSPMSTGNAHQLICKTCQSRVPVDNQGEFESTSFNNKNLQKTLRQLFILKHQYSRERISA